MPVSDNKVKVTQLCPILWDPMNSSPGISQVALVVRKLPANVGDRRDVGSIPRSGRTPGWGHSTPLQYSCLENPHGQRSLAGHSPVGCTKWNPTKATYHTARTLANQVSLSMEFSRKEYWSGVAILIFRGSYWEIEPRTTALAADSLPSKHHGSPGNLDKTKEKY